MAIDFPNSPTNGQTFTVGDTTWTYDGSKWNKNAVTISGPTGPNPLVIQPGTPSATNVLWLDTDATSTNPSVPSSVVDNKGELLVGTAADTVGVVTRSTTNGDMLVVDTSTTSGLRWQGQANTGRNLIINGAMQVAQRGTSTTGLTGNSFGYFTADRWYTQYNTTGTFTQDIQNDAPSGSGLRKSARVLFTTSDSSVGATELVFLRQQLEGQDLQRFAKGTTSAQQFTVSFWVKSNVTGAYILELQDVDNSRTVSASYSISASATWEKKTITFPADTTGVFDNDNNASLAINFWLMAGSNFSSGTLATTWGSLTNANRVVGQTNLAAATNNYWQITGVQLEVGPVATGFDFEPYETTLRKCQRYYYRLNADAAYSVFWFGRGEGSTYANGAIYFSTQLRAIPTSILYGGTFDLITPIPTGITVTSLSIHTQIVSRMVIQVNAIATVTAGTSYYLRASNNTNSYIAFDVEL